MAPKGGDKFGSFVKSYDKDPFRLKPITTEFSSGSVPNSLSAINRESAWSRWRRGYEIATACFYDNAYEYPFSYVIPVPAGTPASIAAVQPTIPGTFVGFPTTNKEFGMHWAGARLAGSLRCDNLVDKTTGTRLYIEMVTEDAAYWYVKLAGNWSTSNPLPPPFYVALPGVPNGLRAINGEILEDRVITVGAPPITRETLDPITQKRYGYIQAVIVETYPFTGILKLRKSGSVEATPDATLVTPATKGPSPNRYLITGARYCCSCQDFTHRDYAFMNTLGEGTKRIFPRTSIASIKPGRYEKTRLNGKLNNNAMTSATVDRKMDIIAPTSQYTVPPEVNTISTVDPDATRDFAGVFREFGATYLRSTADSSIPGSRAEGMPSYKDYTATNGQITSITDFWTPLLDEMRYCKHIYAMKFAEGNFPPEPSDFPVEEGSMVAWEQKLVDENENDQQELTAANLSRRSLSMMDVPPYNCQSPMMMPMMQKLFNIPANFVMMRGFTMYDKDGTAYKPSLGQNPSSS
jgi:hypothetical protein